MEMGNIKLNDKLSDLNEIVSSSEGTNGDNTIALAISDIRHLAIIGNFSNLESFDNFYNSIIMNVGNGGAEAQRITDSQGVLINSLDNQRNSISGVSMDEEMSNMMKYQFAYGASARVMNVLDEMFESIISRMGVVGR
jgi:flagellar hook-associated protein 1 FlgK